MSAESNNCNDFALPDKLYMASSLLDFVLYALSGVPGDLEVPEKSGIGLCYMLGHCQNLIDTAEQESAVLLREKNTALFGERSAAMTGKNSPANLTTPDCLKVAQRGTGDLKTKKKNANKPGVTERDTNELDANGLGANRLGADNPDPATPEAATRTTLKAVWILPDRQPSNKNKNDNWQNKVAAWCSIITAKRAGRPGGRPGQPAYTPIGMVPAGNRQA